LTHTKVVNVHKEPKGSYVYIGRAGHGEDGYFGNPFRGSHRFTNVYDYLVWADARLKTDAVFVERVRNLHGERLGCFCYPALCHGDALVALAEELYHGW